jgi:hypothetical protein
MTEEKETSPRMRTEVKQESDPKSQICQLMLGLECVCFLWVGCCSSAYRVTLVNTDNPTRSRMEARSPTKTNLSAGVRTLALGL